MGALIILFLTAIICLFVSLYASKNNIIVISIIGCIAAAISVIMTLQEPNSIFRDMMIFDHYTAGFTLLMVVIAILVFLISDYGFRTLYDTVGDNVALILFSMCGAICMVSFNNLIMLFLGIEILSIPLYVLAGSKRDNIYSNEAALKYFLMGSFATGFLLMGIALLYGYTGSIDVPTMQAALISKGLAGYGLVGFILVCIAMFFKISAAPFHFWSPDVYQGSPTTITLFMSTIVKIAAFGLFGRLMMSMFAAFESQWVVMFSAIAALTMLIGNLGALGQSNLKRMLAYSSVAHAGYLILGLVAINNNSVSAMYYYLAAYSFASVIAFGIFLLVSEQVGTEDIKGFNGLAKRKPFLAACMTIALLSMTGIPPLAGFIGKYFLFIKAMEINPALIIVAVINSAISVAYYFRPIIAMYFEEKDDVDNEIVTKPTVQFAILLALLGMMLMMVMPQFFQNIVI